MTDGYLVECLNQEAHKVQMGVHAMWGSRIDRKTALARKAHVAFGPKRHFLYFPNADDGVAFLMLSDGKSFKAKRFEVISDDTIKVIEEKKGKDTRHTIQVRPMRTQPYPDERAKRAAQ